MSEKQAPSLLELIDQISKYIAFFSLVISALTFGLQIRGLSYIFVCVACIAFSVWLWRMASGQKPAEMLDARGQPIYVPTHPIGKRALILGAMALIDLVGMGWLVYNLLGELPRTEATPTPALASSPCPEGMVLIPEGDFWIGAAPDDHDAQPDEEPRKRIFLSDFCIDRTEVSNQEYAEFVQATSHPPPPSAVSSQDPNSWTGTSYPPGLGTYPTVRVSWFDAQAYCWWRGRQLPSEAQWEKAARGTDGQIYPWGNEWDLARANSARAGWEGTRPVDDYSSGQSPYGVLNMAGNVAEWVADWYLEDWYISMPKINPTGPPDGTSDTRVVRGGSFWDGPQGLRASARNGAFKPDASPLAAMNFIGFRCACRDCVKQANS